MSKRPGKRDTWLYKDALGEPSCHFFPTSFYHIHIPPSYINHIVNMSTTPSTSVPPIIVPEANQETSVPRPKRMEDTKGDEISDDAKRPFAVLRNVLMAGQFARKGLKQSARRPWAKQTLSQPDSEQISKAIHSLSSVVQGREQQRKEQQEAEFSHGTDWAFDKQDGIKSQQQSHDRISFPISRAIDFLSTVPLYGEASQENMTTYNVLDPEQEKRVNQVIQVLSAVDQSRTWSEIPTALPNPMMPCLPMRKWLRSSTPMAEELMRFRRRMHWTNMDCL